MNEMACYLVTLVVLAMYAFAYGCLVGLVVSREKAK